MKLDPVFTTKLGKLYKGDCIDVMHGLPAESIDCFFADPPFNLNKTYGEDKKDNLPEEEYLNWCYKWINEGVRLLKPQGSLFIYNLPKWNTFLSTYLSNNSKLNFRHWVAIKQTFSLPIKGRLYPSHYSLIYFVKGNKPKTFNPPRIPIQVCRHCGGEIPDYGGYKNKINPKGLNLSDIWLDIPPVRHNRYKKRKENVLSLKLLDRILDISTEEGDIVLDPFGGSGTTYVAGELKKRNWIGIEITTSNDIIARFKNLSADVEHFKEIRKEINVLFTDKAMKLRKKNGRSNGKYFAPEHIHEPQLSFENMLFKSGKSQ